MLLAAPWVLGAMLLTMCCGGARGGQREHRIRLGDGGY